MAAIHSDNVDRFMWFNSIYLIKAKQHCFKIQNNYSTAFIQSIHIPLYCAKKIKIIYD